MMATRCLLHLRRRAFAYCRVLWVDGRRPGEWEAALTGGCSSTTTRSLTHSSCVWLNGWTKCNQEQVAYRQPTPSLLHSITPYPCSDMLSTLATRSSMRTAAAARVRVSSAVRQLSTLEDSANIRGTPLTHSLTHPLTHSFTHTYYIQCYNTEVYYYYYCYYCVWVC